MASSRSTGDKSGLSYETPDDQLSAVHVTKVFVSWKFRMSLPESELVELVAAKILNDAADVRLLVDFTDSLTSTSSSDELSGILANRHAVTIPRPASRPIDTVDPATFAEVATSSG